MTDAYLAKIESVESASRKARDVELMGTQLDPEQVREKLVFDVHSRGYVVELLAEVRRLQGLIKQAEWAAEDEDEAYRGKCPWCGGSEPRPTFQRVGHEPTCPAFGSTT